jgi:hypothetical protein
MEHRRILCFIWRGTKTTGSIAPGYGGYCFWQFENWNWKQ